MATPDDDSVGGEDSVPAIVALFDAERREVQSILGHALSLISILVAYSTVVGAVRATDRTLSRTLWFRWSQYLCGWSSLGIRS
jgi:hypothetical protein